MMLEISGRTITPGIFLTNEGKLLLLHCWATSSQRGAKKRKFVFSMITGGIFDYRYSNYAELFAPGKVEQLCYMTNPMGTELQREVFDNFMKNPLYVEMGDGNFEEWAEQHPWPLQVSWTVQHFLNFPTFIATRQV
jgi:hypothetical protein